MMRIQLNYRSDIGSCCNGCFATLIHLARNPQQSIASFGDNHDVQNFPRVCFGSRDRWPYVYSFSYYQILDSGYIIED